MTQWTVGRWIGTGFAVTVMLAVLMAAVSYWSLSQVVEVKDRIIAVDDRQIAEVARAETQLTLKEARARAYLLTGDSEFLDTLREARGQFQDGVQRIRSTLRLEENRRLLDRVEQAEAAHQAAIEGAIAQRKPGVNLQDLARAFESDVRPKFVDAQQALDAFQQAVEQKASAANQESSLTAARMTSFVGGLALLVLMVSTGVGFGLTRTLTQRIGGAVHHIQSSSTELQSAASQQASAAKEQTTAMNEIATTIKELLSTSRQIADSARRVASVADETASSARHGDLTVRRAHEAVDSIKHHVDQLVSHMLDLGRKSQQIGTILDIINELAEQTNILSINATIEAAGAGEAARRFMVVADEIRKLADRVGGSTRDIRGLIEEIRAAVNASVMATETGSKAVEAGARQFAEVTAAFGQIGGLVTTTTEAAREIELSTKQQTSAVEQVNTAVANVMTAARETESSSGQTLLTATQLTTLSTELARLTQPAAAAH